MGISYPANTVWRHRALCRSGRADVVLREYRELWASLPSDLLGLRPLAPGSAGCEIRPALGDLGRLETTAHTPLGPSEFEVEPVDGGHRLTVTARPTGVGRIVLPLGPARLPGGRNVFFVPTR
jgi:hypothetical protein